ncbi:hypothetical protein ACOSQ3_023044 [Xanthoceras sorbifolium]
MDVGLKSLQKKKKKIETKHLEKFKIHKKEHIGRTTIPGKGGQDPNQQLERGPSPSSDSYPWAEAVARPGEGSTRCQNTQRHPKGRQGRPTPRPLKLNPPSFAFSLLKQYQGRP